MQAQHALYYTSRKLSTWRVHVVSGRGLQYGTGSTHRAMATSSSSSNLSRSPTSSGTSCPDWIEALKDRSLNATIFGINRMSIRDSRPKNILKCLEADRCDPSRSAQLYRQLYLSDGLAKADHMYTTDVKGHHGCVNTLALSNQGEEFLVSGNKINTHAPALINLIVAIKLRMYASVHILTMHIHVDVL